ncbi:MAG: glucose-1-phosphate adenylyltransferase subunit GlgD [Eubacterium sp.]|nr:glucose-1-phosphate adenylyltransferase subunit GlgD [Eubacterium sp.]
MIKGGKSSALGIIFPNIYDKLVPELTTERLMASVQFGGRYRMIDFILSSMTNSGINNIAILVRENYFSLLDHLGSGREWDLARKNGGLNIFPPFAQRTMGMYAGRIEALASIVAFLKNQTEKYVVLSDTHLAINFDFKKLIKAHEASGADVTMVYNEDEIPQKAKEANDASRGRYYSLNVDESGKITKININPKDDGVVNLSCNIYVMARDFLIEKITEASLAGGVSFERDIFIPQINTLNIQGYKYDGYVGRIFGMKSYFDENMKLLDDSNLDALFSGNPIYTKIRDDNPTRYKGDAKAENVLVADGCIIEGTIENSILFRGVKVEKGAVVKNCILMQDTVVKAGADVEYVITDKKVTVTEDKSLKGTDSFPVFVAKRQTV